MPRNPFVDPSAQPAKRRRLSLHVTDSTGDVTVSDVALPATRGPSSEKLRDRLPSYRSTAPESTITAPKQPETPTKRMLQDILARIATPPRGRKQGIAHKCLMDGADCGSLLSPSASPIKSPLLSPLSPLLGSAPQRVVSVSRRLDDELRPPLRRRGTLQGAPGLPEDWSHKTRVLVTASSDFAWCQHLRAADEAAAMAAPWGGDLDGQLTRAAQLRRALMYHVHPARPWPKVFLAQASKLSLRKGKTGWSADHEFDNDLFIQSHKDWEIALRSLYTQLKTGHCTSFYLRGETFSAMFCAVGGEMSATLTTGSDKLCRSLQADGVDYNVVTEAMNAAVFGEEEDDKDGADEAVVHVSQERRGNKVSPMSEKSRVLVFSEAKNVYALYDFLLNHKYRAAASLHVATPQLLATSSFLNGTLRLVPVVFNGSLAKAGAAAVDQYQLDVGGPVLPECFQRLCGILAEVQPRGFSVKCTLDPVTCAFNASRGGNSSSGGNVGGGSGAGGSNNLDDPETLAARHRVRRLNRMAGLTSVNFTPYMDGGFTFKSNVK